MIISYLPNGFLLIRCPSHDVLKRLLTDGPWSLNGIILQLSPWKSFFELAFAKLSTAAIVAHLGPLIKVDDLTLSLTRSKFA